MIVVGFLPLYMHVYVCMHVYVRMRVCMHVCAYATHVMLAKYIHTYHTYIAYIT